MKVTQRVVKTGKRGRPRKAQNLTPVPSLINFDQITKLNDLSIDKRMLESMKTGVRNVDDLFSFEGGVPCASNIMAIGDPGVGKTSIMLDILASIQTKVENVYLFLLKWVENKCLNIHNVFLNLD